MNKFTVSFSVHGNVDITLNAIDEASAMAQAQRIFEEKDLGDVYVVSSSVNTIRKDEEY